MRIMVVDDERAVRESLRRALELEGYEIELAEDGGAALSRLQHDDEAHPDWRILDAVLDDIGKGLQAGTTVSVETTLPIGTTRTRVAPSSDAQSSVPDR